MYFSQKVVSLTEKRYSIFRNCKYYLLIIKINHQDDFSVLAIII